MGHDGFEAQGNCSINRTPEASPPNPNVCPIYLVEADSELQCLETKDLQASASPDD